MPHVRRSIEMYSAVLDLMREAEYQEVVLASAPATTGLEELPHYNREDMALSYDRALTAHDRQGAIEALDTAHDRSRGSCASWPMKSSTRAAPVSVHGATEPYPTRASDIHRLADRPLSGTHRRSIGQMLKQWYELILNFES